MNLPLPTASSVDPWPEILHHLPTKVTYKGAPVTGDANTLKGFAGWLIQNMPAVAGSGDADSKANSFLLWLRSETRYEADAATRMAQQAAVAQAPPNPISSQTMPQVAQMAPPAPQPVAAAAAPAAPGEAEAESGPGMLCAECQQKVSGMRGYKRHVTMTHKTEWPAFCTKFGLDPKTGTPGVAQAQPTAPAGAPPPPPQASPVPPMFQASGPAQPFVAPAPPPMPAPAANVQAAPMPPMGGMAAPPMQVPTHAPAPGPMVSFDPATAPPLVIQPGLPGQQQVPFAQPQQAQAPVQPQTQPLAQPTQAPVGGPTREDLARMLGGPVDLIIVRLLDAATVNLTGRVDVNQIAAVAESRARSEMKVADLAQASYGQGKQAAQRHFGELLSQAPGCYMLLNGYDPILPDGYLQILAARVTKFHIVTDAGRSTTTIF